MRRQTHTHIHTMTYHSRREMLKIGKYWCGITFFFFFVCRDGTTLRANRFRFQDVGGIPFCFMHKNLMELNKWANLLILFYLFIYFFFCCLFGRSSQWEIVECLWHEEGNKSLSPSVYLCTAGTTEVEKKSYLWGNSGWAERLTVSHTTRWLAVKKNK